jgi:dienelactone hydrolase
MNAGAAFQTLCRASQVLVMCLLVWAPSLLAASERPPTPDGDTPVNLSIFSYFQDGLSAKPPLLDIPSDPQKIPAWREELVTRLRDILGLQWSLPVALEPQLLGTYPRDGYRLEHVMFRSEEGVDVPAYVLIPDGVDRDNPAPAVLCLQGGNDGGKDEMAGELEGNPAATAGYAEFHDDIARQMVRAGFVSMTIDMRTGGERAIRGSPDPFSLNGRGAMAVAGKYATLMGQSYFGLNLFDAQRALDYLQTRPEVLPDALGCAGFSFGGTLTAWLAALDRRVKVVALEGNWASWRRLARRDLRNDKYSRRSGQPAHLVVNASVQVIPGFFRYMDMNLTVAAVAPTPMVVSYESESPWQFDNLAEAEQDVAPILRAYEALGKPGDLHLVHVKGGHHWRADVIMPWFTKRLKGLVQPRLTSP